MVIPHGRCSLDRIAIHIIAFEKESKVIFFDGNLSKYHEDMIRCKSENTKPGRI
jgi:energy-dependent translational throttle protein EttA